MNERLSIVIIDDDKAICKLLKYELALHKFDVYLAKNGRAGIKLAKRKKPDVILLDWVMPGKDGVEVCSILRNQDNPISHYIILLTGKSDKNDITRGLNSGADDYIIKPYDKDELKARMNVGLRI